MSEIFAFQGAGRQEEKNVAREAAKKRSREGIHVPNIVMAGPVPAIHCPDLESYCKPRLWIAGTRPAMTDFDNAP